jgi:lactoylglutathione lyase
MVVSMTALATTFATGHVGLNVADLDRSVDFYAGIFGWSLKGRGDRYAFLGDDSRLILTLWQQAADGTFATDRPGLHHLSFEVDSVEAVRAAEERVRAAGLRLYHDGIVPHGEGASSGGIFFEDPDGIRLEIFTGAGVHGTAPSGAAPTCGFF